MTETLADACRRLIQACKTKSAIGTVCLSLVLKSGKYNADALRYLPDIVLPHARSRVRLFISRSLRLPSNLQDADNFIVTWQSPSVYLGHQKQKLLRWLKRHDLFIFHQADINRYTANEFQTLARQHKKPYRIVSSIDRNVQLWLKQCKRYACIKTHIVYNAVLLQIVFLDVYASHDRRRQYVVEFVSKWNSIANQLSHNCRLVLKSIQHVQAIDARDHVLLVFEDAQNQLQNIKINTSIVLLHFSRIQAELKEVGTELMQMALRRSLQSPTIYALIGHTSMTHTMVYENAQVVISRLMNRLNAQEQNNVIKRVYLTSTQTKPALIKP